MDPINHGKRAEEDHMVGMLRKVYASTDEREKAARLNSNKGELGLLLSLLFLVSISD